MIIISFTLHKNSVWKLLLSLFYNEKSEVQKTFDNPGQSHKAHQEVVFKPGGSTELSQLTIMPHCLLASAGPGLLGRALSGGHYCLSRIPDSVTKPIC